MKISKIVRLVGGLLVCAGILMSIWDEYLRRAFSLVVIGSSLLIAANPHLDDDIEFIKEWIRKKVRK